MAEVKYNIETTAPFQAPSKKDPIVIGRETDESGKSWLVVHWPDNCDMEDPVCKLIVAALERQEVRRLKLV